MTSTENGNFSTYNFLSFLDRASVSSDTDRVRSRNEREEDDYSDFLTELDVKEKFIPVPAIAPGMRDEMGKR